MPSPLPTVFLVGPFPPPTGGMERVMGDLLRSPLSRQYNLVPFSTHGPPMMVKTKPGKRLYLKQLLNTLEPALKQQQPALMHLHSAWGPAFFRTEPIATAAIMAGVPVLLHLHSGRFPTFFEGLQAEDHAQARAYLARVSAIAVLSPSWQTALEPWAPAQRFVVIPNGIDHAAWACPQRAAVASGTNFRWLFAGRLESAKGINELINAFRTSGTSELHLYGRVTEPEVRVALDRALRLRSGAPLILKGEHNDAGMRRAYCNAHGFVLPSHYEGLPLSMLEAMAAGLPVVATNVGAIPEVLEGLPGNHVIPVNDSVALIEAVRAVESDPAAAMETGRRNQQRVAERYSLETMAAATDAAYRAVLA